MATVEKTRAIDPEVLADLEAVCNTKGIVRDPEALAPDHRASGPGAAGTVQAIWRPRRSVRKSFVRCTTRNGNQRPDTGLKATADTGRIRPW